MDDFKFRHVCRPANPVGDAAQVAGDDQVADHSDHAGTAPENEASTEPASESRPNDPSAGASGQDVTEDDVFNVTVVNDDDDLVELEPSAGNIETIVTP